jgi:hypothetical protein
MLHNAALNAVPILRAKAAELARAGCKARKEGNKLRLTVLFWDVRLFRLIKGMYYEREITGVIKCDLV